jgi:putative transposase
MIVEYNNLYTHFVFTTLHGLPLIVDPHRERIEKYITGIVKNNEGNKVVDCEYGFSTEVAI